MDNDSDGEEFYDAAEFQPNVSEGNVDPKSSSVNCAADNTTSCSPNKPAVNFTSLSDHSTEVAIDQVDAPKHVETDKQESQVIKDDDADDDNTHTKNTMCGSDATTKHDLGIPCKENESKATNCNNDNMNENQVNTAPVAPPRRRHKKKKERPLPVQDMDFTVEEVKNNESDQSKMIEICGSDSKISEDDTVNADLDISTQEMSEILDRNNYTEVISPQHMSVHLQRNKSQSISSIGSFCSVSSNVSFQEKIKHSASQGSLGSGNEKIPAPATVVVDELTDQEILEQVVVRNLDTGECIPLSQAEKHVAAGVNPLALHIMRLTSEYSSKQDEGGSDKDDTADGNEAIRKIVRKKKHLRGLFGRKVHKLKTTKDGGKRTEDSSSSDEDGTHQPDSYIKIKSANSKGVPIINKLSLIQDFTGKHTGAVWCMKFSCCGKLLATAGQDKVVHVWVLKTEKEYFEKMKAKYAKADKERPVSPAGKDEAEQQNEAVGHVKEGDTTNPETDYPEGFNKEPFCSYHGHTGDVLDLSWSKNYFLLSSSMDKTVRLWHISRSECLCCFQHIDFVTAIAFHPRDDRYFLSGSLDGKIRLWNIPDKKVALWNELEGAGNNLITAANFCLNGKFAVVGTYDGRCIFYITEHLKYFTQWEVRSSRKKQGRKISGIEQMPGEEKILITSNDSRIRLYSLKDHSLLGKYKGFTNSSSQIKGSFSHDGEFVISGSEDHFVYLWRAQHRVPSSRKDRNDFYESFSAQNTVVTAAIFAPCPWNVVPTEYETGTGPEVIVAADWSGSIKIFINRNQNTN